MAQFMAAAKTAEETAAALIRAAYWVKCANPGKGLTPAGTLVPGVSSTSPVCLGFLPAAVVGIQDKGFHAANRTWHEALAVARS